jgi:diguanylate cyclase (GGDEF)-like protein
VCRRPADLPARYGGEEFIVSLPDTDGDGALRIAEKIRSGVEIFTWNIAHRRRDLSP